MTVDTLPFLDRLLPVIVLVVVMMWFMVLVLTGAYKSDAGNLYGLTVALVSLYLILWLSGMPHQTFPLADQRAVQLLLGAGLFISGGTIRSRGVGFILSTVGLGLLAVTYTAMTGMAP